MEPHAPPVITLDDITVRLRHRWLLPHTTWQIRQGQQWAVLGPNGSGKTTLAKALCGRLPLVQGRLIHHPHPHNRGCPTALVTCEAQRTLVRQAEWHQHLCDFSGKIMKPPTVADWLQTAIPPDKNPARKPDPASLMALIQGLPLKTLLEKPLQVLSGGEQRLALIARALIRQPRLLVLDEPFSNLDTPARQVLKTALQTLVGRKIQLVLITHRADEIISAITHLLILKDGRVTDCGTKTTLFTRHRPDEPTRIAAQPLRPQAAGDAAGGDETMAPVILRLQKVTVQYGDTKVLDGVDWTVRRGENWALIGPNGAGKTTLLKLIYGDQLQVYANKVWLFGHRRGTGESLWEVKRRMAMVAGDLNDRYQKQIPVFEVICSGFFDSVGLYRRCSPAQLAAASSWVDRLELADISQRPFAQLSSGQRQIVLIARAMVKRPALLILDEPANHLDALNRCRMLQCVDAIGRLRSTQLIYVTHHADEIPACTTHILILRNGRVADIQSGTLRFTEHQRPNRPNPEGGLRQGRPDDAFRHTSRSAGRCRE
jgi:molybdate transport system ATP-binding protein